MFLSSDLAVVVFIAFDTTWCYNIHVLVDGLLSVPLTLIYPLRQWHCLAHHSITRDCNSALKKHLLSGLINESIFPPCLSLLISCPHPFPYNKNYVFCFIIPVVCDISIDVLLLLLLFKILWSCFPFPYIFFPDVTISSSLSSSSNILYLVENKDFLTSYLLSCRNIISKKNGYFSFFRLSLFFCIAEAFLIPASFFFFHIFTEADLCSCSTANWDTFSGDTVCISSRICQWVLKREGDFDLVWFQLVSLDFTVSCGLECGRRKYPFQSLSQ